MFWKLAAILCILNHSLMPCCAVACAARVTRTRAPATVCPAARSLATHGCCKAVRQRCNLSAPDERTPRSEPVSPCGTCRCRPPKDPCSPPVPTPEPRSLAPKVIIFDAATEFTPLPDSALAPARFGHDPPAAFGSHNDRQAHIAIWLK